PLDQALDQATLAGRVAPFADDDDAGAGIAHPVLQIAKLHLQLLQLLFIVLGRHFLGLGPVACGFVRLPGLGLLYFFTWWGSDSAEWLGLNGHWCTSQSGGGRRPEADAGWDRGLPGVLGRRDHDDQ